MRRTHPAITLITREGGTPALIRALRAGSVDLALLRSAPPFRAPDNETPPMEVRVLTERALCVAVPATHPLARNDSVAVADLHGQRWIAGPNCRDAQFMGVWPGLDERPEIVHTARDWLAKLSLVAAGAGITTISDALGSSVPQGVRVLTVHGGPDEQRRLVLARLPVPITEPLTHVAAALRVAAQEA